MAIDKKYIVDDPSPDNPLLMKDGGEYTGEENQDNDEDEDEEENRVIWKGKNAE